MKISVYTMAVETFVPTLDSLATLLDKGQVHAQHKGIDLVNARLAPDMYTLAQQVQLACYHAKDATARLSGARPVPLEEAGKSFPDLKLAIAKTITFINGVPAAAFEGAEERDCSVEPPKRDYASWVGAFIRPKAT